MNKTQLYCGLAAITVLTSTAACKHEATGQVAAVINGDEITLQELNNEIGDANLPNNADTKAIQQAALQRVLDRRLLAQAARDDGLDKTSEYLLREKQLNDALVIQLMTKKVSQAVAVPTQGQIDKFMSDNPVMFAGRTVYSMDRLQFQIPADRSVLQGLQPLHTMAAIAGKLDQLGLRYVRSHGEADFATMPRQALNQILSLPPGEPFIIPENGIINVNVITSSRPEPLAGPEANKIAVQALRNQEMAKTIEARRKGQWAAAKVEYQKGFAPPKQPAAAAATPAKP
jgi:EpsD family peptidyl-prolyl cis-trans isomerase